MSVFPFSSHIFTLRSFHLRSCRPKGRPEADERGGCRKVKSGEK